MLCIYINWFHILRTISITTGVQRIMKFEEYKVRRRKLFEKQPRNKEEQVIIQASNSLGGEVGELQNVVKKIYRDHDGNHFAMRKECVEELGGIFWYLLNFCEIAEIDPEEVFNHNIRQLEQRYND